MQNKLVTIIKLSLMFFVIYFTEIGFSVSCAADLPITNGAASSTGVPSLTPQPTPSARLSRPEIIPAAPDLDVKSYIVLDANSGYVIAEKNANKRVAPASLTKVMSLYLAANALRTGQVHYDDQVIVSEKAWRTGGSRMFIKLGSSVSIQDLIKGSAIASGNDATVAIAEHLAGTELAFVDLMNQTANNLKMDGTHYADSSGLPHGDNYSTASDLAILARSWIANFPEYYIWFKDKWITYNGIKQPNRNRLLWHDSSVDGMKTGHTEEAGYCLIASAMRNDMRLIVIIMGSKNDSARASQSKALLNYGFRFFETHKLFAINTTINTAKVLLGKKGVSDLGLQESLYVTLPVGQYKNLKANASIYKRLKAPIEKGKVCGELNISLDNKVIVTKPLVALQDNPKANFIFTLFDYIKMLF
ncbi:MAG: D-alanyl-D-alanine carboxypeptidase [Gammaproteobacteria bacterium]|nr:D-alanyl-D-alanine carboxypeptidase [Gammaproteobacteria bacterium]